MMPSRLVLSTSGTNLDGIIYNELCRGIVSDASRAVYVEAIEPCRDCGKAMRPQRTSAADYPGTVVAKDRGLCTWDYQKRTKNGTLDQIPLAWDVNGEDLDPAAMERIERMKRDAILWHRDWRKRTGRDHTAPIDLRQIIRTAA